MALSGIFSTDKAPQTSEVEACYGEKLSRSGVIKQNEYCRFIDKYNTAVDWQFLGGWTLRSSVGCRVFTNCGNSRTFTEEAAHCLSVLYGFETSSPTDVTT